jgi:FtsP/CotA-like multicopper oxidase with cupredoxin domain
MANHLQFPGVLPPAAVSRRRFVEGLALGGVATAAGLWSFPAHASLPELRGTAIDLSVGAMPVNFSGRASTAITVNGSLPAPLLRWREGDTVTVRVRNTLGSDTSIHWHGLQVPAAMDGVPGFSFHGIGPGDTFTYRFPLRQSGTYWYHSHSAGQEQRGLYGPIIIEPRQPEPFTVDRDYVVMFSDWTDEQPEAILAKLKAQSDYYNHQQRTAGDFLREAKQQGLKKTLAERREWAAMRMNPTDRADVSASTYTYLVNGCTPAGNWTGLFRPGEKIRLRFINGSAMSYFDVRIPGLKMTVVAADGQRVEPVSIEEFRLAVAETLDVLVEPVAEAYTIFAQSMDRSGYARATLAAQAGRVAAVPALDKPVPMTMDDLGMAGMAGMDMSGMEGMQEHPASESNNPGVDMQAMSVDFKLDDPGIGLHNNGRRVLTYADLKTPTGDPDGREPERTIELHLTGHMNRYMWSFDGVPFASAEPLRLKYGERVRIVLVNDTMMEHPIHLHGMWSDLEDENGKFLVRKHTISVPPGCKRSYRVTADALGRWAYHCHLMFHMDAGMFREVRVEV